MREGEERDADDDEVEVDPKSEEKKEEGVEVKETNVPSKKASSKQTAFNPKKRKVKKGVRYFY